ncbi:hypothetical protein BDR26DRAFT_929717 [Obelidium mucronatum]|nr:hypothetical protein BDR26DRAFT_929717 [Obelidium mucronatum]
MADQQDFTLSYLLDRRFSLPNFPPPPSLDMNLDDMMNQPFPTPIPLHMYMPTSSNRRMSTPFLFSGAASAAASGLSNELDLLPVTSEMLSNQLSRQLSNNAFLFPANKVTLSPTSSPLGSNTNLEQFNTMSESVSPTLLPSLRTLRSGPEAGEELVETLPTPTNDTLARRESTDSGGGSGGRVRFRPSQEELECLIRIFNKNPFPSVALRLRIAERMKLDVKQVQFWFQNRRATMKTNGILVVKPKKSKHGGGGGEKKNITLTPLSANSSFFFVETHDQE